MSILNHISILALAGFLATVTASKTTTAPTVSGSVSDTPEKSASLPLSTLSAPVNTILQEERREQSDQSPKVDWISFEEAVKRSETDKRKILIDVYTDWCGWCKVMDNKTFSDPHIASLLNEKFYAVKFNAEQKEDVTYRGHTFKFVQSGRGGYHELAASLLNNKLSYPNFVFMNGDFHIIPLVEGYTSLPGFRKPEEFHIFLSYVADDHYKRMKLAEFQQTYKSPYNTPK